MSICSDENAIAANAAGRSSRKTAFTIMISLLGALVFPATSFSEEPSVDPDYARFLLKKKGYCSSTYVVKGGRRVDEYCLKYYRELVDYGVDGEAYAYYCDLIAEQYLRKPDDKRCDKADKLNLRAWKAAQDRQARESASYTASNNRSVSTN